MAGQKFIGHWKLDSSENWDEYMKAIGIGFVLRKVGNSVTPYEEWKQEGDNWSLNITSTFKNKFLPFVLGVEFDEETMDGRNMKSLFTLEGDKLVQKQIAIKASDVTSSIVREITADGQLLEVYTAHTKDKGDISAKRFFKPHQP